MIRFAAIAVIPLFAGFLYAQNTETTTHSESHTSTTRSTNWDGTLVDASCRASHSEHHESSSTSRSDNGVTSRTESSHSESSRTDNDCPVTSSTTSFGFTTPDGHYMRFDNPSNTRIVQEMRTNKTWTKSINDKEPVRVHVVGTPNGDVVVMDSIR